MKRIEQTLDSREVAEMIGKEHNKLLRDIRRYEAQFNEANIGLVDFFREDTYEDSKGETRPCYRITKKGCEFIAHKLTGTKGTAFTARYINKFHEMENTMAAGGGLEGIAELRTAVEEQGKMLSSINRKLSGNRISGTAEQEMYKNGIVQIVTLMNDTEALRKVYTFAKYVPQ